MGLEWHWGEEITKLLNVGELFLSAATSNHLLTLMLNVCRSAQSVCLAACALLDWCLMGKVPVLLKTCALASITGLPTNLEKALRLTVIHGMFRCSRFVIIFYILYTVFIMNLRSLL